MKKIKNLTYDDIKKAVIYYAIQGKLIKQSDVDEPADKFIEKIFSKKEKESFIFKSNDGKYYEKIKDESEVQLQDLPFNIPHNWMWVRQKNICELKNGKKTSSTTPLPYLEMKYIRQKIQPKMINNGVVVSPNDLMMLVDGENSGEVINPPCVGFMGSTLKLLKVNENILLDFLMLIFEYNKDIYKNSKKGIAIPHLDKKLFENFLIPIPPIDEQKRIVKKFNKINDLLNKYNEIQKKINELEENFFKKIKKSIIDFAIKGKLEKFSKFDEPINEFIDFIKRNEEKKLKEKGKNIRLENSFIFKDKNGFFYEQINLNEPTRIVDLPFEVPKNWTWLRIKSFSNVYTGNSINKIVKETKYKNVQGWDYIATKDISFDNQINYNNGVNIPVNEKGFKIAPENKVLMCIEGGSAGSKIAITSKKVCFGNKLACFDTIGVIDLYLFYFLQSHFFIKKFKSLMNRIISGVSVKQLKNILVPLPSISEQKRIVNKLNQIFSLMKINNII